MKTLTDFRYDGENAIETLLVNSEYGSVEQAIASLTLFTHPHTVKQTSNRALFRIRRYKAGEKRKEILQTERVVLCDNLSPAEAFLWANGLTRNKLRETQYNHVYQRAYDPEYYTSLANICVTPAFLGKLTDKSKKVKQLLKYRVWIEYGFLPIGEPEPEKPTHYDSLIWANYLPACSNLRRCVLEKLETKPKSRIALSIQHFGWIFSNLKSNPPDQYPLSA
jgi:hypothetical protein